MRRVLVATLAALTAVAAWALPAPDTGAGEVAPVVDIPAGTRAGVWFCPGAAGEVDPILTAAVLSTGLVGFSLPMDGEILDGFQSRVEPGVAQWDVGDGLFFHPGPATVETSSSPSAASVLLRGPGRLGADGCYTAAKEWFLNGASVDTSRSLTLRLFNPLLEQGRVELEVVSEFGFEPLLDLESVGIAPRSWEDVSLSLALGTREQVAVRVTVIEGVVIPSMYETSPAGLAVWPGESPSAVWEFPRAQLDGTSGLISVWNPGTDPAQVSIELNGVRGPVGRFEIEVAPGREERFDVSEVTTLGVGAVVTSSGAVVAVARSDAEGKTAAAAGAARPRTRWLVPAHNSAPDLTFEVFVLNSGDEPVTVTAGAIGGDPGDPVEVPARATARVLVAGRGADISASGPVSVAWAVTGASDPGLALAVPIEAAGP
ncbi:MAG: hypothetical protein HKN74_04465 [Acidimicrobiia bacterium]|nr:hypothetical protein [Acidimicrobiia bacterium]MBT8216092.1 hypothetical protein [Acidimicrobiia bacterium]NNF09519.1 hypothetical protein [Acidimicrobiia bacterium]NNL71017.1 hypothetical protein [Acidimicrobiia bacterium]